MRADSGQQSLEFDLKLGAGFIRLVPMQPGVYLFKDQGGLVIYVGKAKNLRQRLSQYRLASRKKKARKMRSIVRKATSLEYKICASEQEALLLENQLILEHKPELNIAGAFSFLYPYLGLKWEEGRLLSLCYTTSPELMGDHGFQLYGAFRSRLLVSEAFGALACLLPFLGHPTPKARKKYGDIPYTRILCFRQVPLEWQSLFEAFFRGESVEFIQKLVLELLEKPSARQLSAEIQSHLGNLKAFYKDEALKLRTALSAHERKTSMIPQNERDRLFLSLT